MVRGKHARKTSLHARVRTATSWFRPALGAIATFAAALVAVVIIGVASGGAATPSAEDYAGKTSLAARTLPQVSPFADSAAAPAQPADSVDAAASAPTAEIDAVTLEQNSDVPPTTADMLALPDPGGVFGFCCDDPSCELLLSRPALKAVDAAQAAFADEGDDVGFLFMNLTNGCGVASNIDELFYSASTMKAPFATFVSSVLLDGGRITLGDTLAISYAADLLESGIDSLQVEALIENAILYSDNDSYRVLRANFESLGFAAWLESLGLDPERLSWLWYPDYSVREAAVFWLATYDYLQGETPHSQWLASLLEDTEVSFIRDGIGDEPGVSVANKAGWIADGGVSATNDAGIVTIDGTPYLLCILSDAPDSGHSEAAVATLARALFALHSDLRPSPFTS